ncbi:MAG: hypothetical protein LBJ46_08885 [Planctomycetota bacterium]|jgi:chemotaxis methyl-accepting protein methylase|nr:hypothetical protein [Planctomycetota bacterium]
MADDKTNPGRFSPAGRADGPAARPPAPDAISCRATNPLSLQDNLSKVFLDERQAKATTATRLFRSGEIFAALAKVALPAFFASKRAKFTMWSAGCSSGEEVYSMAMIALNEFARAGRRPVMEAFGTDINPRRIAEARRGAYIRPSKDAFSRNCWLLLERYARVGQHQVAMGGELLASCRFSLFDMRTRPKKHTFFFIVCNHVLQYYDSAGQRHIIENLKAVLNPGGYLYLEGVTEACIAGAGLRKAGTVPNLFAVGPDGREAR